MSQAKDPEASDSAKTQAGTAPKSDAPAAKDDEFKLPPFPADRTVHQTMQLGGRVFKYDVTVGSLPVLDEKGKTIASVMFTAYTVPGENRPVTFATERWPGRLLGLSEPGRPGAEAPAIRRRRQ
jgi:carboxypeptidase C (cathepsin A)